MRIAHVASPGCDTADLEFHAFIQTILLFVLLYLSCAAASLSAAEPNPPRNPGSGFIVDAGSKSRPPIKSAIDSRPRESGRRTLIPRELTTGSNSSRGRDAEAGGVTKTQAKEVADLCRANHIRVIPCLNCLGINRGEADGRGCWTQHPELDEKPGKYPNNEGIYCRSWCPLHPETNKIVFPMIDELIDAFFSRCVSRGDGRGVIMASEDCPRCKGKDPVNCSAKQVNDLHAHLVKERNVEMLCGGSAAGAKSLGYSKWEA